MADDRVSDDELALRHIPGGITFQAPGPRITSENFKLRPGETGVSVSRSGITTPAQLMARIGDPATGSQIAIASVAAIRGLGFEVAPDPRDYDPGHAEIRSAGADLSSHAARRQLAKLFAFLPVPGDSGSG